MKEYKKMFRTRYSSPPPKLHVLFQGVDVAELEKQKERYVFRYFEAFRRLGLAPFPGLADVSPSTEHRSAELPRFFAERIPDVRRPEVRELIRREQIPEHDELALLAALGRMSVTDPFELVLQAA
ncbi:MAG: HipA N-terminal domain-containing protein [Terriglobales bacterium]